MKTERRVYVISDLHLGGEYPAAHRRGFRLCTNVSLLTAFVDALTAKDQPTELVINGDLVDFLAEADGSSPEWMPFLADADVARRRLDTIVARDRIFFDALARFLEKGHRLVVLLGNHDIELALPLVRDTLLTHLLIKGKEDFHFIYDGEAYVVGSECLIEHGNRYDPWNTVDHDGLRRLRSRQSRKQPSTHSRGFEPPAGSRLVSEVINPVKQTYAFVDLLKPECDLVIPLLLALEPAYRDAVSRIVALAAQAWRHRMSGPASPRYEGDIAAIDTGDEGSGAHRVGYHTFGSDLVATVQDDPGGAEPDLRAVLEGVMGMDAETFLENIGGDDVPNDVGGDISAFGSTIDSRVGLLRLFVSGKNSSFERRLRALLQALRVVQSERTFDPAVETLPGYLEAAEALAKGGFRFVVFGHTHLRRRIDIGDGATYLNTGSWTDVMRFPPEILKGPEPQAMAALRAFVADIADGRLAGYVSCMPTYARLDFDRNGIATADLLVYSGGDVV